MTALSTQPANLNFLSPINFLFALKRAPAVNFFIQKANIPGLSLPAVDVPTPNIRYPYPGDHLLFEEFEIQFKVDEDLQNYLELHNWIRHLGRLNPSDYQTLNDRAIYSGESLRSDISLQILNSFRRPNYEIVFREAFPIQLSGIKFDTTSEDVSFVSATCTFKYLNYTFSRSNA